MSLQKDPPSISNILESPTNTIIFTDSSKNKCFKLFISNE